MNNICCEYTLEASRGEIRKKKQQQKNNNNKKKQTKKTTTNKQKNYLPIYYTLDVFPKYVA